MNKTDLVPQIVNVMLDSMMMNHQIVLHVHTNVKLVPLLLLVLSVLLTEKKNQIVPVQPELMMLK